MHCRCYYFTTHLWMKGIVILVNRRTLAHCWFLGSQEIFLKKKWNTSATKCGQWDKKNLCSKIGSLGRRKKEEKDVSLRQLWRKLSPMDVFSSILYYHSSLIIPFFNVYVILCLCKTETGPCHHFIIVSSRFGEYLCF